jgi:hypothetical protein
MQRTVTCGMLRQVPNPPYQRITLALHVCQCIPAQITDRIIAGVFAALTTGKMSRFTSSRA